MINQIQYAHQLLSEGKLVSFPTETVYGLGADATNPSAIQRVFQVKQRPTSHPLIVHISSINKIDLWAKNIPPVAKTLAHFAWPGPLTMVLPKNDNVSNLITGGQDTIALRIPRHPLALSLLRKFSGLVGPSANAHCHISPTQAAHVSQSLGSSVDFILDGGACEIGIESTIVNCKADGTVEILRQGMIGARQISQWIGNTVYSTTLSAEVKVPGNLKKHYSPKTQTYFDSNEVRNKLANKMCAFLCCHIPENLPKNWTPIIMPSNVDDYAKFLYAKLYQADNLEYDAIVITPTPKNNQWQAVYEKLNRATSDFIAS
ncbi:MAG: threonylcarbamoyl-AMP synthase [Francisellaceae bacterium]|nr:threonylcarbamoyl-AMP synthase [Francisellaceae bacterium]